jgi:hypothetical protein
LSLPKSPLSFMMPRIGSWSVDPSGSPISRHVIAAGDPTSDAPFSHTEYAPVDAMPSAVSVTPVSAPVAAPSLGA